ncbi:MAG: LacI family DNA-binding transcriptional regulator [Christensenellales bacterium]
MENGRVTIYDVAERAGVSIATVSRAMSGGSISAKSRQKVQEAIDALHYQPSTAHRTRRAGEAHRHARAGHRRFRQPVLLDADARRGT